MSVFIVRSARPPVAALWRCETTFHFDPLVRADGNVDAVAFHRQLHRRHVAGVDLPRRGHGAEAAQAPAARRGRRFPAGGRGNHRRLSGSCWPHRRCAVAHRRCATTVPSASPARCGNRDGRASRWASAAGADRAAPAAAPGTPTPRPSDAARRCRCPAGTTGPSRLAPPAACRASAVRSGDGKAARRRATSSAACRGGCRQNAAIRTASSSVGRLARFTLR